MFKSHKAPPDARILRIRDYEDKLVDLKARCKQQATYGAVAEWQARTDEKLARNAVLRDVAEQQAEREAALAARRQRLAVKLYEEDVALQRELLETRETPGEKRAALASRARGLWEARELERQARANVLLEQHFRENSDALRQQVSQQKADAAFAVRQRQVEDRTMRRANELREQAEWDEMDEFEGLKARMRGIAERQKRFDDQHLVERTLDAQLRDKHRRRAEEVKREASELARVEAYQAAQDAAAAARDEAARREAKALSDAIRAYNDDKQALDAARGAAERAEDRAWMDDVLRREALQMQAEAALRQEQQAELRRWVETLRASRVEEDRDQIEMDKAIADYQAEQHARYDAQQQALADARAALLSEVHAARERQIAEKAAQRAAHAREGAEERERLIDEARALAELEAERRASVQRDALRARLDVAAEAAYKAERKRLEVAERFKERQRAEQAEERYQAKVAEAAQHPPQFYYGRPKVQWFY